MKKYRKLNLGKITIATIHDSHRIKGGTGAADSIETDTCGCPPTMNNEHSCAPGCTNTDTVNTNVTSTDSCDFSCGPQTNCACNTATTGAGSVSVNCFG